MSAMNILDIIVLLLLAGAVLNGLRRGFVLQVARLVGFILALVVAFRFSPNVAEGISQLIPLSTQEASTGSWTALLPVDTFLYRIVAFVLLFFVTKFIIKRIAGLLHHVVKLPVLNSFNRLAGGFLAVLQTGLIVLIVVNVLQFIPGPKMQSLLQESWIASWMINQTPIFTKWLEEWINSPKT